jgi:hypothetical protein
LETDSLTVELTPLLPLSDFVIGSLSDFQSHNHQSHNRSIYLFHFFVRRVLAATAAEFLEFQPLGRRLAVLRRRIVPLFAVTTL